jgi:hypothetical protein
MEDNCKALKNGTSTFCINFLDVSLLALIKQLKHASAFILSIIFFLNDSC